MLKVIITNSVTSLQYVGQFETQAELNAWISACQLDSSFGKNHRFVTASTDGSVLGEDVSKAIGSTTVTLPNGSSVIQYEFAPEYTIGAVVDISAQVAQEKAIQKAIDAQQFGNSIIATVWAMNTASGATVSQVSQMMDDPLLSKILFLCQSGSIETAYSLTKTLPTTYFTQSQINQVLAIMAASPFVTNL